MVPPPAPTEAPFRDPAWPAGRGEFSLVWNVSADFDARGADVAEHTILELWGKPLRAPGGAVLSPPGAWRRMLQLALAPDALDLFAGSRRLTTYPETPYG